MTTTVLPHMSISISMHMHMYNRPMRFGSKVIMILLFSSIFCCFPITATTAKIKQDFRVNGLEDVVPAFGDFDGEMYAGLLPIDDPFGNVTTSRGELMFWLFQPTETAESNSLTIWFNGGPGCTSFQGGVLFECSPVTTPHAPAGGFGSTANEPLVTNHYAWTKATNMLFVEQPVNTGFSWGLDYPNNEEDLSIDFYNFLIHFYEAFPDYQKKDLYLFGESYAGMYVPSMAHQILKRNRQRQRQKTTRVRTSHNLDDATDDATDDGIDIDEDVDTGNALAKFQVPLKGIGLGNGWMDAMVQGPAVIDYAWWHGMIDSSTKNILSDVWKVCQESIDSDGSSFELGEPFHPFTVPDECNIMGALMDAAGANLYSDQRPNAYDVTTWDYYPLLWDDNSTFAQFYNNPAVKKALNAPMDVTWQGCIPGAGRRRRRNLKEGNGVGGTKSKKQKQKPIDGTTLLAHDEPASVMPYIAELLDTTDVKVLIYSGDRDLTTCAQGSELLLDSMEWTGRDGWTWAPRGLWLVPNEDGGDSPTVAGYAKEWKNLQFVTVYNSGHLVPHNKPAEALDLITRMVMKDSYVDQSLPSYEHALDKINGPAITKKQKASAVQEQADIDKDEDERSNWWTAMYLVMTGIVGFVAGTWHASRNRNSGGYRPIGQ